MVNLLILSQLQERSINYLLINLFITIINLINSNWSVCSPYRPPPCLSDWLNYSLCSGTSLKWWLLMNMALAPLVCQADIFLPILGLQGNQESSRLQQCTSLKAMLTWMCHGASLIVLLVITY